jgi:hypothetical protein
MRIGKHHSVVLVLALLGLASQARADWFAGYTQYEYLPALGQIRISDGYVRGKPYVEALPDRAQELEKAGVFSEYGQEKKVYTRRDTIGSHSVETVLTVYPPLGHGYGGANFTKTISITIDGKKKVDCNLGYVAPYRDLTVHSIAVFPEEGLIDVLATSGGKIQEPPLAIRFIKDDTVITNESFFAAKKRTHKGK